MPTLSESRSCKIGLFAALVVTGSVSVSSLKAQGLPKPPIPWENPITPEKVVLGKILYWDEQLSSDNTMACGSCHQPAAGGADPRIGRNPGPDGIANTPDDILGSPGVVASGPTGLYSPHATFGLRTQVTGRIAPTNIGAAYLSTLRWDGQATETYVDPQTKQVMMMFGGALENHALGPPLSDAEMAYAGRSWTDIAIKIAAARPLAMASQLTPDLVAALASQPDYGELMRRAYGDRKVTATRIIYAITTYQRTLNPDQTPWDSFANGNAAALTSNQKAGLALFEGKAGCVRCHSGSIFTDGSFRNLGLRPVHEDIGWQLATLDPIDRGKFKVPTLRNVGLRNRYMHNGQFATLADVLNMYDAGGGAFNNNRDPILKPLGLTSGEKLDLIDFLQNALTDPRVAAETVPFDRPTLYAEHAISPYGTGHAGTGGFMPQSLHASPMSIGNAEFRIGINKALGGAPAFVAFSGAKGPQGQSLGPVPIHIALSPAPTILSTTLQGSGAGNGYATMPIPIPNLPSLLGGTLYHQWLVLDAGAAGGLSATSGVGGKFF